MKRFDLEGHLQKEHRKSPISQYLREIVYGGNDGIVTTFAVVAGFAGAGQALPASPVPVVSVLLFGLANLFADGLSMSLGSFLSIRADQDVYRNELNKESREITHSPDMEFEETVEILRRKNFSEKDARSIAVLYRKNPEYWTEFMMTDELEMADPGKESAAAVAVSTFLAFIIFGAIPLIPFIFGLSGNLFFLSIASTALALFLLGLFRSTVTGHAWHRGVGETLFIGGISAGAAYFVGTFFRM